MHLVSVPNGEISDWTGRGWLAAGGAAALVRGIEDRTDLRLRTSTRRSAARIARRRTPEVDP
jgi:phage tail tape-measure protein